MGEELDFQLRTLAEWGYLKEVGAEELGITRTDSSFYRLNTEDREVKADAVFSSIHIDEYHGGSIEQFLNKYSEHDSNALRKRGVNFYKAVG